MLNSWILLDKIRHPAVISRGDIKDIYVSQITTVITEASRILFFRK